MNNNAYPRDLTGYGPTPPHAQWPGAARIALQFVLNYEEGSENDVLEGDTGSETFLSEMINPQSFPARHMSMESLYEYGARAGLWRLLRVFEQRRLPLTVFGTARALQRNPEATAAFLQQGHEIACHALRWISYQNMSENVERGHIAEAVSIIREMTGNAPLGWYTGRDSPHTRRLIAEHGGIAYNADSYADDLPYWQDITLQHPPGRVTQLVVPYTLDSNDMRYTTAQGFNSGTQFFDYLKDAFDVLYAEGDPAGLNRPKMLSVGLHCRISGRPARTASLARFLDYVQQHDHVWITRRIDIAEHWRKTHPPMK